jgi:hypothetical protein
MYRRRRAPAREPVFGFDSFLDLVTNVLGIIIRLILVAWVGGRAYSTLAHRELDESLPIANLPAPKASDDPLDPELAKTQLELAQARARLLDQLKQLHDLEDKHSQSNQELLSIQAERRTLDEQTSKLDKTIAEQTKYVAVADLSLAELKDRSKKVIEQIQEIEKLPNKKKAFHFHSPVSRAVHAEELMFECQNGRVTFIDLGGFMDEVKRGIDSKGEALKTRWEVSDVAGPIGAFQLRYVIERRRGLFNGGAGPAQDESFSYGLSGWVLEPTTALRGETGDRALAPNSEFQLVLKGQDLRNTVVTFWVYPDSFGLFRRLRDYLYEQGAEVAGRPLPNGAPIAASRYGSASRGQ